MATLFQRPTAQPGQTTYYIDLPGATDLFSWIIPALNDKELKKQRIERMRTKKSPVPEPLQWVPDVITEIDDAQDLLTTALWLAKPLIRKLPSRFVPYVGWALTASDIANLSTFLLSQSMTPGLTKPDIHKKYKNLRYRKKDMAARVADFLKPGGWRRKFGDIIQAAQASDTVTGVGLTLGSIMGCLSDSMWATYALAKGERVEVRLPPENDYLTKAYRVISMAPKQFHAREILSAEDHAMILAAQNLAIGEIMSAGVPINDERINLLMDYQVPVCIPWEESSIEALQEEGFDLSRENYYKAYIPAENPTYGDAIDLALESISDYNDALRSEIGTGDEGSIFWTIGRESGIDTLSFATGWEEDDMLEYTTEQISAIKLAEYNLALVSPYTDEEMLEFLYVAMGIAENLGRTYPSKDDFIEAAEVLNLTLQDKE